MRSLCLCLVLFTAACSGASSSPADAGPADAGACDPSAQTGCGAGEKCTIRLDTGALSCGAAGGGAPYEACASDADCAAGTTCLTATPQPGFDGAQSCRPLCDPGTQARLGCSGGGRCDFVDRAESSVGFCERELTDAGP